MSNSTAPAFAQTYYGLSNKRGADVTIVVVVFGILNLLSFAARFYCKIKKRSQIGWDDYILIPALLINWAGVAITIAMTVNGGMGNHTETVGPEEQTLVFKLVVPAEIVYAVSLGLIKLSIARFFFRIFGTESRYRIASFCIMGLVTACMVQNVIQTLVLCRPFAFNWDPTIPDGVCGNKNAAFVANGALNMVTDLMIMLLPMPYLWKLQMSNGRKLGLTLVFSLGLFVTAISIIRMQSLIQLDLNDAIYQLPLPVMWSFLEPELLFLVANLMLCQPLFAKLFPKWLVTIFTATNGSSKGSRRLPGYESGRSYPLKALEGGSIATISHVNTIVHTNPPQTRASSESVTGLAGQAAKPGQISIQESFLVIAEDAATAAPLRGHDCERGMQR